MDGTSLGKLPTEAYHIFCSCLRVLLCAGAGSYVVQERLLELSLHGEVRG